MKMKELTDMKRHSTNKNKKNIVEIIIKKHSGNNVDITK